MNPKIKKKTSNTSNKLDTSLFEKKLEELKQSLDTKIEEEIAKRIEFEKNMRNDQLKNVIILQELKNKFDKIDKMTKNSIDEFKISIEKDLNSKTKILKNLVEENIGGNNNKDNPYVFKVFALEENIQAKLSDIENQLNSSSKNLIEEINTNTSRIDFLEKKISENNSFITEQISNINQQIISFQKEYNILNQFKDNLINDTNELGKKVLNLDEIIKNFINNISTEISNFKENMNSFTSTIENEKKILKSSRADMAKNFEIVLEKNNLEFNNMKEYINKEFVQYQNEIEHLESHILSEQDNFNKFTEEKINMIEKSTNNSLAYSIEDINTLKKQYFEIEKVLDDIRDKTFTNINELEQFQTKKYEILLKILINNNLVPPDFDYKKEINKSYLLLPIGRNQINKSFQNIMKLNPLNNKVLSNQKINKGNLVPENDETNNQ